MRDWSPSPLRYWLSSNDAGAWGGDPTGIEDTPVVRSTEIALNGSWQMDSVALRSLTRSEQREKCLAAGELVVVKASGSPEHLGKTAIVTPEVAQSGACFSNFVQRLRPSSKTDSRFLWYFLNSSSATSQFDLLGSTTTGLRNLSGTVIASVTFPGPPLDVQRAIADFLDAETAGIDTIIAQRRAVQRLLEERAVRRINDLFSSRHVVDQQGVPIAFEGLETVRLGYFADIQTGLTLDASRNPGPQAVSAPYLRVANVQDGHLDLEHLKEVVAPPDLAHRCLLQEGDVLMTEGGDPDKLGRGTVWPGTVTPCLHQNHIFAVRPNRSRLLPEYLALLTRTTYARRYFEMTASKTTGIASTSSDKIKSFRIPLPDLEHQRRIVQANRAATSAEDESQVVLERQLALLRERRQALITAAVTGELDIPGAA